jgi:uncharacterized protein YkwD
MVKTSKRPKRKIGLKDRLLHMVWPHAENGFRPHIMRPIGLLAVLSVAYALPYITNSAVNLTPDVKGVHINVTNQQLLDDTNDERVKNHVALLNLDEDLNQAALLKAKDMFKRNYWAHNAPDGTSPWHWFREVNYRYDFAGENLAKGFTSAEGVVTAWMNSPEHRENLLNENYDDVGFAVVAGTLNNQKTTLVVAMYGSPVGNSSAASEPNSVLAATDTKMNWVARFGLAIQTMSPAVIGSVGLLLIAAFAALAAHAYRHKLPKNVQKSWKRHHGLYTLFAIMLLIIGLISVYSGASV